jgi:hypothetical protein
MPTIDINGGGSHTKFWVRATRSSSPLEDGFPWAWRAFGRSQRRWHLI